MEWIVVAKLIVEIGLPAAVEIIDKWANKEEVTADSWRGVKDKAMQSAADRTRLRLIANGIDPDSDEGHRILSLVG